MKALALYSGGVDSALAIKLIQDQGIEVVALNFVSYFFGGKNEKIAIFSKEIGVNVEYIDFKDEHLYLVKNPLNGYGKNMNPCIDCHGLMLKTAGKLLEKYGANFVITGEVLGERPMSQNIRSLAKVEKLSEIAGLIVRPLSAKVLDITIPEEKGWIDRNKLLDIQGRGRKRQLELLKKYNLNSFPTPGGGCMLTEPNYSNRLEIFKEDNGLQNINLFYIARISRLFRLDKNKYLFISRNGEENIKLNEYEKISSFYIKEAQTTPGPTVIGIGNFNSADIDLAKKLFSRYSKSKGKQVTDFLLNGNLEKIDVLDEKEVNSEISKYLIL